MPNYCFSGLDFLRTKKIKTEKYTKKSDLHKMAIGAALFSTGLTGTDSIPLHVVRWSYAISGGFIALTGATQLLENWYNNVNESNYADSYEKCIHAIAHNKIFLTGAAFSIAGVILRHASNTKDTSDSSLACSVVGITLMGLVVGEQISKEYSPHIIAFFNT